MKLTEQQKEIRANALLLAEFEGYEVDKDSHYGNIFYSEDNERTAIDTAYHNSWHWLMGVVKKIDDIFHTWHVKSNDGDETLEKWYEAYPHFHLNYSEDTTFVSSQISDVYKEVVEFVNWFNENNAKGLNLNQILGQSTII